jgi:hypothetical protein
MWKRYIDWCNATGEEQLSNRAFGSRLRAHGVTDTVKKLNDKATRVWQDVLLQAEQTCDEAR